MSTANYFKAPTVMTEDDDIDITMGKMEATLISFVAKVPVTLELAVVYFGSCFPDQTRQGKTQLTIMVFNILADWLELDVLTLNEKAEYLLADSLVHSRNLSRKSR